MRIGDGSRQQAGGSARAEGPIVAATAPVVEPRVGDRIGPYRLVRLLGAGAAGRVFEVEHERLGRRAAMKTLAAGYATHPGAIRRLFAEAMAVNRINNPHIVEVTDLVEGGEHRRAPAFAGATSDAMPVNAIVMELLEGQSLSQAMRREGPLEPERFLGILAQVARALTAAHTAGFAHRDLKPDNIFLIDRGRTRDFVKLLDFGLAKALGDEAARYVAPGDTPSASSSNRLVVGTPAYLSPEQASGRSVDHRGDIYALGVILFELVTGRLPFEGGSASELLIQHVTAPAPHLPPEVRATRLGAMLDAVVQRCLEKDPAVRFPSASPLARMFEDLGRGGDVAFTGLGHYLAQRAPAPPAPTRREVARAVAGVTIGLGLALVAGGAVARLRRNRKPAAARPAEVRPAVAPGSAAARAPDEVTLTFESAPPGVEVVVEMEGKVERLGVTPFQRRFPRSQRILPLEFRVPGQGPGNEPGQEPGQEPGNEPMQVPTPLSTSRTISVTLAGH